MWSGPRNISTAMMRAWENRTDCTVIDEPFYPHYLQFTGIDHPMADDIISHYPTDLDTALSLVKNIPDTGLIYQKQIITHMLEHIPLDWIADVSNLFLIRHPAYMVSSYSMKREQLTPDDFGYPLLEKVFDVASSVTKQRPIVVDSTQFLGNPSAYLKHICQHLNIDFQDTMLSWPKGTRSTDGIWEAHWYDSVKKSSGFGKPRTTMPTLNTQQQNVVDACMPHYNALKQHALLL